MLEKLFLLAEDSEEIETATLLFRTFSLFQACGLKVENAFVENFSSGESGGYVDIMLPGGLMLTLAVYKVEEPGEEVHKDSYIELSLIPEVEYGDLHLNHDGADWVLYLDADASRMHPVVQQLAARYRMSSEGDSYTLDRLGLQSYLRELSQAIRSPRNKLQPAHP